MIVSQASKIWLEYHRAHSKYNTVRAYEFTIAKFNQNFANLNLAEVSTDDIPLLTLLSDQAMCL